MEKILNSQIDIFNIENFLKLSQKYTNQSLNLDVSNMFKNSLTGNINNIFNTKSFINIFSQELNASLQLMVNILVIIVIHSILKSIIENLENSNTNNIVFWLEYLLIITIITDTFVLTLNITKNAINEIVNFMNLLVPLLISLILATGNIVTTTITEPVILFMINFIGNFINDILIPILLFSVTLSIISNFSGKIQTEKIAQFFKSSIIWFLTISLTVFSATLSIEGSLSSSVDGVTAKTAKAAVSSLVPVVGKIVGDTVDSVIGCGNILKNSVGIIGIIVIIGIVITPIMKTVILWIEFKFVSAICDVVADAKIVKLLEQIGDAYKILSAMLFSVSLMFIIGITIVLKITNSQLMYR